jgi:hypothetical protein
MELKNIVKENLLDVKYEKQQFEESLKKIKKLQNFLNNHILETKKEKEIFAMKVFDELLVLESNGFYSKLITEEEWKGFPTWVWDTIKEKVVRKIIGWVAPSKKDSWAADVIVTGLGDIDINEIPKLGDCDFVTKQLAKAIVEGSLEHVKREKLGISGGISDVVRNALVETLEQNEFFTKLEEKLTTFVCPNIRKVGNQFSKMGVSS